MTVPDWRTHAAGARVRAALWLHSEVGVGSTFTKAELRAAFPGVEQVDRRMRDLRPEGWVIATYREDPSLDSDELRLVREGGPVWEKGYRSQRERQPSEQDRQAAFAADGYMCVNCGISGGEPFPDDALRQARLSASRVQITGSDGTHLVTLCDRCRAGAPAGIDGAELRRLIAALPGDERAQLHSWMRSGERSWSPAEQLWALYRRLPASERDALAEDAPRR